MSSGHTIPLRLIPIQDTISKQIRNKHRYQWCWINFSFTSLTHTHTSSCDDSNCLFGKRKLENKTENELHINIQQHFPDACLRSFPYLTHDMYDYVSRSRACFLLSFFVFACLHACVRACLCPNNRALNFMICCRWDKINQNERLQHLNAIICITNRVIFLLVLFCFRSAVFNVLTYDWRKNGVEGRPDGKMDRKYINV